MNQDQVKDAIKYGRTLEVVGTLDANLTGARVLPLKLRKTDVVRCQLAEDWGAFKKGDPIRVATFALAEKRGRLSELRAEYDDQCKNAIRFLEMIVKRGKEARQKVAAAILRDDYSGPLVEEMRWGHGVDADFKASIAARVLAGVEEYGIEMTLHYGVETVQRGLANNEWGGGSSSLYSNAVDETRRQAARELVREMGFELREIRKARAMIEVL